MLVFAQNCLPALQSQKTKPKSKPCEIANGCLKTLKRHTKNAWNPYLLKLLKQVLILQKPLSMKSNLKRLRFLLILIPLGLFIRFIDLEVSDGFLATNETVDHYKYMLGLVAAVALLLSAVLYFEKNTEK